MAHDPDSYFKALREVSTLIQILIYRLELFPIKDRDEALNEMKHHLAEMIDFSKDGKQKWRKGLLELAAYAIFAAVSDE